MPNKLIHNLHPYFTWIKQRLILFITQNYVAILYLLNAGLSNELCLHQFNNPAVKIHIKKTMTCTGDSVTLD